MEASPPLNRLRGWKFFLLRILNTDIVFCPCILSFVIATLAGLASCRRGIDIVPERLLAEASGSGRKWAAGGNELLRRPGRCLRSLHACRTHGLAHEVRSEHGDETVKGLQLKSSKERRGSNDKTPLVKLS